VSINRPALGKGPHQLVGKHQLYKSIYLDTINTAADNSYLKGDKNMKRDQAFQVPRPAWARRQE
jgi:hypothetical protein